MEYLFLPSSISEELQNSNLDQIKSDELDAIKHELFELDKDYQVKDINLGAGADWIWILGILRGITSFISLGDKIDKGLQGWINVAKRLNKLFSKSGSVLIDQTSAKYLVLLYLSEKYTLTSLELTMQSEVPIKDLSGMLLDRTSNDFIAKPYAVYLFAFVMNNEKHVILSVRSDGVVTGHYRFDTVFNDPF